MKQVGPKRWWRASTARCAGGLQSVTLVLLLAGVRPALAQEAPSKATCARAYESAQESRAAGQLEETRSRLTYCAQSECPAFVQRDCSRWLEEVQRELPSVVVTISGLSAATPARVQLDGKPISDRLGSPIELDPGQHELVIERAGQPNVTRTILAQQGVQNRAVQITLDAPASAPVPSPPSEEPAGERSTGASPMRSMAYAAWGVGLVGLGTFAVLGTLGRADERSLRDDCPLATDDSNEIGPGVCARGEIVHRKSSYQREYVAADVGLYAGLAAALTGTALFILSAGESAPKEVAAKRSGVGLALSPTPHGAWASWSGSF